MSRGDTYLSQVPVVVALHLVVEHLTLLRIGVGDQLVLDDLQNVTADVLQLRLDLALVRLDQRELVRLAFLLDGRNHTPRRAAGTDDVLVRHRQQVALLHRQLLRLLRHCLHVVDHLVEP